MAKSSRLRLRGILKRPQRLAFAMLTAALILLIDAFCENHLG